MYNDYNKLTLAEQKKLIKFINDNYKLTEKQIISKIEEIKKENKKQKEIISTITPLIVLLWSKNKIQITKSSINIMQNSWVFYEYVSVMKLNNPKVILSNSEISKLIQNTITKREKIIKWNKVIKGNTKKLDKNVKNIIKKGIKNNKTVRQIQNDLEKTMKLNRGKAKSIAMTETSYYKSESKLQVGQYHSKKGNLIIKKWIYTYLSNEHRQNHINANGQTVIGVDSMFNVGGKSTVAPQHFGDPSEDINCTCDYSMEYDKNVDTSIFEYNKYKEAK